MSGDQLLVLSLAVPLVGAVIIALAGRWPDVRDAVSVCTAVLAFGVVAALVPEVRRGTDSYPAFDFFEIVPGLPLAFEVEPLGMLFGLIASGLWIVTSAYSIGYMRGHHEKHQTRFSICFAVAIFAALGVAFAGNLLTLFIFYEVLTLSTYPLITHHGTPEALRAGRIYLGILLSTSVGFLFLAIAWTWHLAGTTDFRPGGILRDQPPEVIAMLLPLYFFGIGKAALMPFHRWLPNAMVAPTPVSALLHAVAVVKAGVFSVLKVVVYVFGIDVLSGTTASTVMSYVAGGTILIASLVAMTKDNLKARLAYSTISQLSYIVLGGALATGMGVIGGAMHIAMHAFGKITLFFCAGAIMIAAHKTEISTMAGIGRRMPVTLFAFLIGSLSVIGLPPFGGSWSKFLLALGTADAGHLPLVAVLMISSLLNIAYLIPVVLRGFFLPPPPDPHDPDPGNAGGIREAPLFCVVPICITAAGCVALFFFADDLYRLLAPIALGGTTP